MSSSLLSRAEQFAHRSDGELSRLNEQDFLALKQRLTLLDYYPEDTLQSDPGISISEAYKQFKEDIGTAGPGTPSVAGTRGEYAARAAQPYIQPGQSSLNPAQLNAPIVNDIARAAVADSGGIRAIIDNTPVKDYGTVLQDKIDGLVKFYQAGELDAQGIALLQGALRSSDHPLKIDGIDGPKTQKAIENYVQERGAHFTAEEKVGLSGGQDAFYVNGRAIANDANKFSETLALPENDDISLSRAPLSPGIYDARNMPERPLALDSQAQPLDRTQVQMVQGLLNTAGGDMDPRILLSIDGRAGEHTMGEVQRFFEEKGIETPEGMAFDDLNSHHFELMRDWALENRDELLQSSRDMIQPKIGTELNADLQNGVYNDTVAGVQGTLNMLGHRTKIDGLYGGQTAKNLFVEPDKYAQDPDRDFLRRMDPQQAAAQGFTPEQIRDSNRLTVFTPGG